MEGVGLDCVDDSHQIKAGHRAILGQRKNNAKRISLPKLNPTALVHITACLSKRTRMMEEGACVGRVSPLGALRQKTAGAETEGFFRSLSIL